MKTDEGKDRKSTGEGIPLCPTAETPTAALWVIRINTAKSWQRAFGEAGLSPGLPSLVWGAQAPHTPPPLALTHSPQDVVHTHDALGLQVARVVDDRPLRLQPHVAPMLR